MRYGNKKSLWNKLTGSSIFLIIIIIVLYVISRAAWNMHQKFTQSDQKLNETQMALAEAIAKEENLREKVDYLSTDQGIESEIRSKFRVARDGESVAVIVDGVQPESSENQPATPSQPVSWWKKTLKIFGL